MDEEMKKVLNVALVVYEDRDYSGDGLTEEQRGALDRLKELAEEHSE